jgi:hypothetical protein
MKGRGQRFLNKYNMFKEGNKNKWKTSDVEKYKKLSIF